MTLRDRRRDLPTPAPPKIVARRPTDAHPSSVQRAYQAMRAERAELEARFPELPSWESNMIQVYGFVPTPRPDPRAVRYAELLDDLTSG